MMRVRQARMHRMARRKGRYLPNGFQSKSKVQLKPPSPNAAATPRPAVGFFRKGFWLGSSQDSPTGSASASSFVRMSMENIKQPPSSAGLFGFQHVMYVPM